MKRRAAHNERGAFAVLAAILAIVLFTAGALAIDLGNAYSRARSQQARADLTALSAGHLLPVKTNSDRVAVAQEIANYLWTSALQVQDDGGPNAGHHFTGQELIDSGAVTFSADGGKVTFNAPNVQVDFGLANAFGAHSINVRRKATVGVFSISESAVAPLYAVVGCDYGSQVLKDAPNGQTPSAIPPLETVNSNNQISMGSVLPTSVSENQTPQPVVDLTGDFNGGGTGNPSLIDAVGFFRDKTGPTPYTVQPVTPTSVTASTAKVVVPSSVLSATGWWFVRVREGGKWSDATTSAVLSVGTAATPTCPAGSSGGNFGQLNFGDVNNPNDDIVQVFKKGPAKNIVAYPGSSSPAQCNGLPAPALIYDGTVDNANCVYTETGFKPNAATAGLLSDGDSRLRKDTTPRCGSVRTPVAGYQVNNDYLSCFLTDGTTTLGAIENSSYSGPSVLSADIVKSPRFFIVPVFAAEPATGHKAYKIIGFRPAFLTDQPASATRGTGPSAGNGITVCCGNKVQSLNFILFSEKALPDTVDSGLPTSPTYAFGPKVIKLID